MFKTNQLEQKITVIDLEFQLYYSHSNHLKKEWLMNSGKSIFSQIMQFLPLHEFRKCVKRYQGNYKVKYFSCLDQFLSMAFAQLTFRESLRDIESCLRAMKKNLYHMGFRTPQISRSTLAKANENRDWRIFADFAQILMQKANSLYKNDSFALDLKETIYALDSSIIKLCLSLCPWAYYQKNHGGIKIHTLLNLRGNIPSFLRISRTAINDYYILDQLIPEPGSFYIMDRGYIDFSRLYTLHLSGAFFIIRNRISMINIKRMYSHPVDKSTGLRYDQTSIFYGRYSGKDYPEKIRRIKFFDDTKKVSYVFLTNNFLHPALTIANLYKCRWQVELFFKWIKQHLRIKAFYGTSENAVKTQIWIAISIYVLVAIIKKQLKINLTLYTILQIFSVTLFEKVDIFQVLMNNDFKEQSIQSCNQLQLFNL
jgi:hypothetical protein